MTNTVEKNNSPMFNIKNNALAFSDGSIVENRIMSFVPFTFYITDKIISDKNKCVFSTREELNDYAIYILVTASYFYNPLKGKKFVNYLAKCLEKGMKKFNLFFPVNVSSYFKSQIYKVKRVISQLQKDNKEITTENIQSQLDFEYNTNSAGISEIVELDDIAYDESNMTNLDNMESSEKTPYENCCNNEELELVEKAIQKMSPKNQRLYFQKFVCGYTYTDMYIVNHGKNMDDKIGKGIEITKDEVKKMLIEFTEKLNEVQNNF